MWSIVCILDNEQGKTHFPRLSIMTKAQNRRLAVILFADIAGYTALMQKDEENASTLLRRFQQNIQTQVSEKNGQVINFYGDGALCIFNNPLEAMQCAIGLQSTFTDDPEVPVRIGLHSGSVVLEGGKIYGDSVNITSRIESMGVPNSILFSKKIRDEIKNQPNLRFKTLGQFAFKNVDEKIEVYALANPGFVVPKKEHLKGKRKSVQNSRLRLAVILLAFFVVALTLVNLFKGWRDVLPDEILDARIAVLPYENNTNDSTLNVLGTMAADWITRNLINLEDVRIVQFENVKDNLDYLQANPLLFQQQTGLEKMIRGKFYLVEPDLIFETQVVNPNSSEVIFVFPIIRGNRNKPSELLSELSQKIAGYFASQVSTFNIWTSVPKYKSLIAIEEGHKYFGTDYEQARAHYLEGIQADTSFVGGYLFYAQTLANEGRFPEADSMHQLISSKFPVLSKTEKALIEGFSAQITGDVEKGYHAAHEMYKKDPKNFIYNYQTGYVALGLNRPQTLLDIYQKLDPAHFKFDIPPKRWWFGNYAHALMRLERFDEALTILKHVPQEIYPFYATKAQIYVYQNQTDSLELLIKEMEDQGEEEEEILGRLYKIAFDFGAKGDKQNQLKWGNQMLTRIQRRPESIPLSLTHLGKAYFITEDYENMLDTYEQVRLSNGETWEYLVHVGFIHAKMGNLDKAYEFIEKFQALENEYSHGQYKYAQALIYAGLDKKEEAVRMLKQAFKEGRTFHSLWEYNYSYELSSLQGYAPFEEFVRPKS